nr:immunoglobulin heavy chain junction region [Macaca mulatta]MOX92155.1 immunoglobulin heavy chain junction region [Macaca mulatta]MOX92158.1 immunoglobulin heavy chain junction region [Macaca mulatta]MOX92704.1 immunoglobulin heavy chain junction region [Macaca mulatta]MOX92823.1 immunoglobulin heavy chain junction region [Macaca mulatta]
CARITGVNSGSVEYFEFW